MNSHFIPRFLTRPWEFGSRRLAYADLTTRRISVKSSRRLFAKEGAYPEELELWLGQKIESPFAELRASLLEGDTKLHSRAAYRTLALALMIAAPRVAAVRNVTASNRVGALLALARMSDHELDALVASFETEYSLMMLYAAPATPLYFPSSGIFNIAVFDDHCVTGFQHLFAMPVSPAGAVALVPRGANAARLKQLLSGLGSLMNASAGMGPHSRIVVVPPALRAEHDDDAIITAIEASRRQNEELTRLAETARSAVQSMYAIAGLPLQPSWSGRFSA